MSAWSEAVRYLNDPFNWTRPQGILDLLAQHLTISVVAVLAAAVIAVPLGMLIGHTGRGRGVPVVLSNVSRAVPTLALLTLFAVTPVGFGPRSTTIALALFAIPPILTNTYVGFRGVDRDVVEASRAMGLTGRQVVLQAELPLALPLIMTGIRTAAVQVVATTTLAALVAGGGLGRIINLGFGQQNYGVMLAGAVLVSALSVATELVLAAVAWGLAPGRKRLPFRRPRTDRSGRLTAEAVSPL